VTHQYRHHILVAVAPNGEPASLVWHNMTYRVAEVLARWHLRDRWWEAQSAGADEAPLARGTASDRHYYRLRCAEDFICEVYWDAASGIWVLDRVLD
jgi:hypothetical protein